MCLKYICQYIEQNLAGFYFFLLVYSLVFWNSQRTIFAQRSFSYYVALNVAKLHVRFSFKIYILYTVPT